MPKENGAPGTAEGAGVSCQSASADSKFSPQNQGEQRTIEVHACPFGRRFVVVFMPRSIAWPSMEFKTNGEAFACADARSRAHGWPVIDRTGGEHG